MLKLQRRRGQGMTEYIIIVGLIAIVLIGAVNTFSGTLSNAFDQAGNKITTDVVGKFNGGGGGTAPGSAGGG